MNLKPKSILSNFFVFSLLIFLSHITSQPVNNETQECNFSKGIHSENQNSNDIIEPINIKDNNPKEKHVRFGFTHEQKKAMQQTFTFPRSIH